MVQAFNKTVLCIVDGFGYNPKSSGNAVAAAGMRHFNAALSDFPHAYIKASGKEVGLDSDKDAGNSEVGHNAIGAGQIIKQGLSLLNDKYATGEIFDTPVWKSLAAAASKTKLNIIILLSDGRVHSDIAHLFRVLEQCKKERITARIFAIADGRDVPPRSIKNYLRQTNEFIEKIAADAKISVVAGRGQIFMDRYESQTELLSRAIEVCVDGVTAPRAAADALPHGEQGDSACADVFAAIDEFYAANPNATDEQLPPFVLDKSGLIKNGDAVLLLNYRGDRAIETARMFDTGAYLSPAQYKKIDRCRFAGALQYDAEKELPKNFLCPPPAIKDTLTEWLSEHGVKQYTVTETVKFGHLTYFFNGNRTEPFNPELETAVEIESDKLNNQYDRAPKMKAAEITDKLIFSIRHGDYSFFKCNLPNPDMVGHTGIMSAVVTACQFVDKQLGRLLDVCREGRINLIITADHGNAEEMTDEKGQTKTSHTNNPVPFVVCPFANPGTKLKDGQWGLSNIAATVCDLLGTEKSPAFNESMIK